MTKKEALLFFPYTEEDDLLDLYEERLFEYKQFFLLKFPIDKVFLAKEKKMMLMHDSFIVLYGETFSNNPYSEYINHSFSEDILESFHSFQRLKNSIKNSIIHASTALEISYLIKKLLEIQNTYSEKWMIEEDFESDKIIISLEPDPMIVLNSILEFNSKGGFLFKDFNSKRNILPKLLFNEAKRLSLCRKLKKNG